MNYALIFAGGTGQRMNTRTVPKQFLELHGKPIIIYTLEQFDTHPEIDGIVVVCLESWIPRLRKMLVKFGIEKVVRVVPGGSSGQESIFHGLQALHEIGYGDEDIVLVHDGVRPLIDGETISANIAGVLKNGNAITTTQAIETITTDCRDGQIGKIINRSECYLAKAPQSFYIQALYDAHVQAQKDGINSFIDSASIMRYYGSTLYMVEGSPANIKITTPTDFYIFRAIVDAREDSQIFGL